MNIEQLIKRLSETHSLLDDIQDIINDSVNECGCDYTDWGPFCCALHRIEQLIKETKT
jgi:hypothetical protein